MNEVDWYEEGYRNLIEDIAGTIDDGLDNELDLVSIARAIYSNLREDGLIDYDIEKDVFYEWYAGDAE